MSSCLSKIHNNIQIQTKNERKLNQIQTNFSKKLTKSKPTACFLICSNNSIYWLNSISLNKKVQKFVAIYFFY